MLYTKEVQLFTLLRLFKIVYDKKMANFPHKIA